MNGSPITTWEGAEAYFTFADSPATVGFIFVVALAVTFGSIGYSLYHESKAYKRLEEDK